MSSPLFISVVPSTGKTVSLNGDTLSCCFISFYLIVVQIVSVICDIVSYLFSAYAMFIQYLNRVTVILNRYESMTYELVFICCVNLAPELHCIWHTTQR